jgi:hypothetical protein
MGTTETPAVEVEVAWSVLRNSPYVRRYEVWINGERLAVMRSEFEQRQVVLSDLNVEHPVFRGSAEESPLAVSVEQFGGQSQQLQSIPVEGLVDALPNWGRALSLVLVPWSEWAINHETGDILFGYAAPGTGMLISLLSHLIVGPGEWVRDVLSQFQYLGPLRELPARNYEPPRFPDSSRWPNGLAAWDILSSDPQLATEVSRWLSDAECLDAGYSLRLKQYKELALDSALMVLLRSERAFDDLDGLREEIDRLPTRKVLTLVEQGTGMEVLPQDVGVGISQLIPVVALALSHPGFAAVEQPELHIHPAIQVRLGDLFAHILSKKGWGWRRLILETHSEHLLLRLLRRIRETHDDELPPGLPGLRPCTKWGVRA